MPVCAICNAEEENLTVCKVCGKKFCSDYCGDSDEKLCVCCWDEVWMVEDWPNRVASMHRR